MSRSAARFREADVFRVLKAATKAGVPVRIEITPAGAIIISTLDAPASADGNNEWDELKHGQDRIAVRTKV